MRVRRTYADAPTNSIAPSATPKPTPASCQPKPGPDDGSVVASVACDRPAPACACQADRFSGDTSAPPICTRREECGSPACACQAESCAGTTSWPPICTVPPRGTAPATGAATTAATATAATTR